MGVGRGYGKLLLFGEHAAVYGHPAVGIRLEEHLEVTVEGGPPGAASRLPELPERERELVEAVIGALGHGAEPIGRLRIDGTLPMSVGFGSSAAFCTALLRAVDDPSTGSEERLWAEAHRLEHVFHGTPSGIDTGLSIFPGASIVYPDPPALPRREPAVLPPAAVLVGAVRRTSSTAELVAGIRELRARNETAVERSLHRLGRLSGSAASPERCPDATALGRIADEAHAILRTLGLSTPELEIAITALHNAGALGAKLSGAGGGGAFYGVFEDRAKAEEAAKRLGKKTAQAAIELVYLRPYELTALAP